MIFGSLPPFFHPGGGPRRSILPTLLARGSRGPGPRAPRRERDRLPPKAPPPPPPPPPPSPPRPPPPLGGRPRPGPGPGPVPATAPAPATATDAAAAARPAGFHRPGHGRRPARPPCARRSTRDGASAQPRPPCSMAEPPPAPLPPPRSPSSCSGQRPPRVRAHQPLPSRRCAFFRNRALGIPETRPARGAPRETRASIIERARTELNLRRGAGPPPPPLRSSERPGRPSCPRLLEDTPLQRPAHCSSGRALPAPAPTQLVVEARGCRRRDVRGSTTGSLFRSSSTLSQHFNLTYVCFPVNE